MSGRLYHVTPARRVPEILREGLKPRIGPRSRDLGETRPCIYLFASREDVDDALSNWLGEAFGDTQLALLEVRLPASIVARRVAFEIQVDVPIPAHAIRVVSADYG